MLGYRSKAESLPMSRAAVWGFGLGLVAMVVAPMWEAVIVMGQYVNYFWVGLGYPGVEVVVTVGVLGIGPVAGILGLAGWAATKGGNAFDPKRGRAYAVAGLLFVVIWGLGVGYALVPQLGGHDRYAMGIDAEQMRAQKVVKVLREVAIQDGRWPERWADVTVRGVGLEGFDLESRQSSRVTRTVPKPFDYPIPGEPTYAADLDAFSDFMYVGKGLPEVGKLGSDAERVVVVCGRSTFAARDFVHVDSFSREYMYGYEARVVGFASGRVRMVAVKDLARVMAESDAVRGKWGLGKVGVVY